MTLKTPKNNKCKYCRGKTEGSRTVCSECYKKLKLIRKIKQIGDILYVCCLAR